MATENATPATLALTRLTETSRTRIGKYRVVGLLGRGGMAEVALVVAGDREATSKLLVVKRILEEHAADPEFVTMFMDEARLALRLNHPNVVQTFEVDSEEHVPFLTMEFLAGQPLNKMMLSERSRHSSMPLAMKVHLVSQWLQGLQHAHTLCDYDGTPLQVVHRDISPHNLFVTYDGVAKVVDFGIAKAAGRMQQTQAGISGPKGKARYMAPEQARNEEVDHRADVFAMGIVLVELLTRQRFWPLNIDEISLLLELFHNRIPSFIPPEGLPPGLTAIVQRAIAPDAADRFPSAEAFRLALDDLCLQEGFRVSSAEVAAWMKESFSLDRERLQEQIRQALARLNAPASAPAAPPEAAPEPAAVPPAPSRHLPLLLGALTVGVFLGGFALSRTRVTRGDGQALPSASAALAPPPASAEPPAPSPAPLVVSATPAPSASASATPGASARPVAPASPVASSAVRPGRPRPAPSPDPSPRQPPPLFLP
ncbi:MAG: serine/threonine protein kinase [Polyangiaceae bacterium]|jgi:serine/threonine-protein kinase|nr:serine/threonine protein kinase [Polyangiaceae bacterium]